MSKRGKNVDSGFWLASLASSSKSSIYVMMILILFSGISAHLSMPRESCPEVKETKIYISSVFPGNTAEDIEKLIIMVDDLVEEGVIKKK